MVTYINFGDIFNIDGIQNYAHGCNCAGAMGKGIALQFKKKFPQMYKQYKSLCTEGNFNLGDVYTYNYAFGYVFNLATQISWKHKADINAVEQSLKKMFIIASQQKVNTIALPKIGAGLGGLKWDEVKNILEKIAENYPQIQIFVVENYLEAKEI